jgi:hypothetical protein
MSNRTRLAFWPGETVRVRATFANETGAGVTATGVAFTARAPTGSTSALTPVPESASTYYADLTVTEPGDYAVRATCAGPSAAAAEVEFSVGASRVL